MTTIMSAMDRNGLLVVWSNRFAGLVQEGFSLVRTLSLLEELDAPYGDVSRKIRRGLEDGEVKVDVGLKCLFAVAVAGGAVSDHAFKTFANRRDGQLVLDLGGQRGGGRFDGQTHLGEFAENLG